jgi:hypothetical protein
MSRSHGFVLCLIAGLLPALAAATPVPGPGQRMPCHDYRTIVETLGKRYGEAPVSLGLQTNGHVLQVFTSTASGSWTILSVAPTGIGCIVAAGKNWHDQRARSTDPST